MTLLEQLETAASNEHAGNLYEQAVEHIATIESKNELLADHLGAMYGETVNEPRQALWIQTPMVSPTTTAP